jgi:CBS domain containing-hemolysin-like protein
LARLAGVLEFLSILLWPIFEVGARLGRVLLPRRAAKHARLFAGRDELKQITAQSEREGTLSAAERAMIHNVVDFWNIKAREVMVPLANIVAVQPGASTEEALRLSASSGLDRLPVITREGQPTGLVNVLDILLEQNGAKPLSNYVRRIVLTTEDELAYRIVQRLRAARLGLAAVLDNKRNLRGVVAIEDLIRRLVSSTEGQV